MARNERSMLDYLALADERPFLNKAFEDKLGDEGRIAYADLVEKRDPERAEWLRLGVALHSRGTDDSAVRKRFLELTRYVGFDYAHVFFRELIVNCGQPEAKNQGRRVRFAFQCPKRWETLGPAESDSVRHCQVCQERVYYCSTLAEAESRARSGECIAIPRELSNGGVTELVLGRPDPVGDWAARLFPDEPRHQ